MAWLTRLTEGPVVLSALTASVVALAVTGCGGTSSPPNPQSQAGSPTPLPTQTDNTTARDDFVRFAGCMREHGIKAEVIPGSRGGIRISGPGPGSPGPTAAEVRAADRACKNILKPVQTEPSNQEEATFRDRAFAFVRCLRRHGLDIGDPVIKRVSGGFDLTIPPVPGQPSAQTSPGWQAADAACAKLNPFMS